MGDGRVGFPVRDFSAAPRDRDCDPGDHFLRFRKLPSGRDQRSYPAADRGRDFCLGVAIRYSSHPPPALACQSQEELHKFVPLLPVSFKKLELSGREILDSIF